jgi:dihydroorotase
MLDRVVMDHCEDTELTRDGVMNEGVVSLTLGLRGMPAAAEEIMVARDLILAEQTRGRLHILHVSTAGSVELIRRAKQRGVSVTCEACVHHFSLTEEALRSFDSNFKMNPPLRTQRDVEAILEGLRDGTIDAIVTDHAPHAPEKKLRELDLAPFGVIGLESLVPICIKTLVEPGILSWSEWIAKLTIHPARILGIDRGTLRPGAVADITILDPEVEWTIDPNQFRSKSRNCPFAGWRVRGRADTVLVAGTVKYRAGSSR